MEPWSYLAMLGFVVIASWWLEIVFKLRVLRHPKRLVMTLLIAIPLFIAWDAFAIAQGHWFFDSSQMIGVMGPLNIPLEEYLFFVIVPIAAVLTWEGVGSFLALMKQRRDA